MTLAFWTLLMSTSAQAATIPDFMVDVYREGQTFGLVLTPPADHHFNIEAPYSAKVETKGISFGAIELQKTQIVFEKTNASLTPSDVAVISVFLCDQAKTYCVKKTKTVELMRNVPKPVLGAHSTHSAHAKKTPKTSKAKKKDEHGFWNNAPREALKESARTKKPLLIDFYGIWCPPCNQYNERVFPSQAFKTAAKKFVLLKMDADQDASWDLKSRFKVGGYPTIVFAQAGLQETDLQEIDRVVGYFPTTEFVARMSEAYVHRNESFETRILAMKEGYLDGLKKLIEVRWEQKDFEKAKNAADEGLKTAPDDLYFQFIRLQAQAVDHPEVWSEKSSVKLINAIHEKRKTLSVETLLRAEDALVSNADRFDHQQIAFANDLLDALSDRVDPKAKKVEGYELSIADLDAMRVDVATALKDEGMIKRARTRTIESYRKLIADYGKRETRGLNLELAYWLWNDGQEAQAKKIYDHFIAEYPKEFTFYFASAKMNLDLKHYPEAKTQAEKAVQYSYGDNHLRSMERLVRVLIASGEPKAAYERGSELLAKTKNPKGYFVRTERYIHALKSAVEDARVAMTASTKK